MGTDFENKSTEENQVTASFEKSNSLNANENVNIKLRFRTEFLKHKAKTGESLKEFSERANIGTYWGVYQLFSGQRPLTLKKALLIAKALNIGVEKLVDEETFNLLVSCCRTIDSKLATSIAHGFPKVSLYTPYEAIDAAHGNAVDSHGELYSDYASGRELIAVTILSAEMSPRLEINDYVIVDPKASPRPGDIVLIHAPKQIMAEFREYVVPEVDSDGNDIYELRPLVESYPKYTASLKGLEILGVVVEQRKML